MFAVIYKFKLKPFQEEIYKIHWNKVANYFIVKNITTLLHLSATCQVHEICPKLVGRLYISRQTKVTAGVS